VGYFYRPGWYSREFFQRQSSLNRTGLDYLGSTVPAHRALNILEGFFSENEIAPLFFREHRPVFSRPRWEKNAYLAIIVYRD
jgi:hypothetical protein